MKKNTKQEPPKTTPPSKGILIAGMVFAMIILLFLFWKIIPSYLEENLPTTPTESSESTETPTIVAESPLDEILLPVESETETEEAEVVETSPVEKVRYVTAESFVNQYFKAYNEQDFEKACRMMDQEKCNADRPQAVSRFAEEYEKMEKGYESVRLWKSTLLPVDFHSQVVCVENKYRYKDDLEAKEVIEVMSFYVTEREDGTYEISSRVCESKKLSDGREGECPLEAVRKFCVWE